MSEPTSDPAEDRMQTASPCQVHNSHTPHSHVNEVHHIWPKGDGGPNVASNRIVVCATGHNNIHKLIDELKASKGEVPYAVLRQYSFKEREYAQLGYLRLTRHAL